MRKFIEMDSAKMGELAKGDEVQVLQHSHALDGTARSEICTVKGARQGWISTKFLSLAAGDEPERPAPEPARGDLKAYAPPVAPAPEGPFSALALEPKRNDGITWNDHQAIMETPRPIVVPDQQTVGARFRSTSSSPSRSFGDSFSDELFKPIRGGIAERDGNSLEAWHAAHADIVVSREIESRRRREMLILAPKDDDDEPVAAPTAKDEDLTIAGFIAQRGGMPSRELQRCLRTTLR